MNTKAEKCVAQPSRMAAETLVMAIPQATYSFAWTSASPELA